MKYSVIVLVVCACVWAAAADFAHVKAAKGKLLGRLSGKGKHHKRGILSSVPTFKLGHDIPHVTHSLIKPIVVNYPPTASVAAVKIPIGHPHIPRYPVPVGHRVPDLPHPHYGLKFPHTKFVAKPDHHFHHHHHHVAPRPIIPVIPAAPPTPVTHVAPAAPVIPVPQPTIAIARPALAPNVIVPAPAVPAPPLPAPPLPVFPHNHLHLKPLLPAAAIPLAPAPVLPLSQPFPYVIRPGGAVQTSVFATYPRYPLINSYQAPLFPVGPSASGIHSISQVLLQRPQINPYQFYSHHVGEHGVVEQHTPNAVVEQTPTLLHPSQIAPQPGVHLHPHHLEPLPQPAFHLQPSEETLHQHSFHLQPTQETLPQPTFHLHPTQETLPQPGFHVHPTQETLSQPGYHVHPTQETLPQPGFHVHPTQETLQQPGFHVHPTQETLPQPGFHLHPSQIPQTTVSLQPSQPSVPLEHDGWSPVAAQPHDANHDGFPQQTHHFTQEQGTQVYEHHTDNQYNEYQHQLQHHIQQQIEQAQYEQSLNNQQQPAQEYGVPQQLGQEYGQPNEYSQQDQHFAQHDYSQRGHDFTQQQQDYAQNGQDFEQHGQDFGHNLGQEYGLPQQSAEGRNSEDSEQQQFHNHIPLGLQPPIDRPLDHFQ